MKDFCQNEVYSRNKLFWGEKFQLELSRKHAVICGLGGVGSFACDALARAGIGEFTIIDFDKVAKSNLNRQLLGLHSNIGKYKADLMEDRIKDINPEIKVNKIRDFYTKELDNKVFANVDFALDAIDSVKYKIDFIESAIERKIPVITSMGAGNRCDASKLFVVQIEDFKPKRCPFIKRVLSKLRKRGIEKNLTIVTSDEKPKSLQILESTEIIERENGQKLDLKKFTPSSTPFVPPVAGYLMANYVILKFREGHKEKDLNG